MSTFADLSNIKFGRLTAVYQNGFKKYPSGQRHPVWTCRCDCGNIVDVIGGQLSSGKTKSCGCYRNDVNKAIKRTTHGMSDSRLYRIYYCMLDRCNNPKNASYVHYGEKGISVCKEWAEGFEAFAEWALSNGYSKEFSIDRINNDKGYFPENCRWASAKEQVHNRSYNPGKRVTQINTYGIKIAEFTSIRNAALAVGVKGSSISKCLAGERKTSAGYRWEYAD